MSKAAAGSQPLLVVRGLSIVGRTDRGETRLLDTVDATLERGGVLGVIGESGAGKSTLGLAAMGFVRDGCRIANGSIRFEGSELVGASEAELRALRGSRIAYVAQSAAAAFNPAHRLIDQSIEVMLEHGLSRPQEAKERALALYRRMQLPAPEEIGFRYPFQVSGGQLQRAMTAMAMVAKPDLIIFDEPTTALDVTTQIEVLAAIREAVRATGTAAIYISHDLALVAQMADRILVLRHGRIVEEAGTATMLDSPKADYTRSLWAVRSFKPSPKATPARADPALRVQSVSAGYGKARVLHDVSLSVPRGATVAVVGESGSGKSTLARVVCGLLPPESGQILLDGSPLAPHFAQRAKQELRRIQLIVQSPDTALNPRQTVAEAIGRPLTFYAGLAGEAKRKRISELLSSINLEPSQFLSRYPSELSGGQRQRVCIARALAADPEVVVCDEVTSSLDQLVAEEILKLLDRLQRERALSYLFITHDLSTVRAIADEVVIMQDGMVVDAGPKERVFAPPHRPYTERLLASVPEMDPGWLDRVITARHEAGRANAGQGR